MQEILESVETHPRASRRRSYAAYLLVLLVLPLACLLLAFPAAHTRFYLKIARRPLWHATDYRFSGDMHGCDVVIAGDSSGMLGVDTRVIEARTGWKTCDFALPYMVTSVFGTSLLDQYLAHNKAPRFIVFHFSGTHLRPPQMDEPNGTVDAWLAADEHMPLRQALPLFLRHPRKSLVFAVELWHEFLSTNKLLRPDWSRQAYEHDTAQQRALNGWMAQVGTAWEVVCGWQPPAVPYDRQYIQGLISRYSTAETQVIIWENPSRVCDTHIQQYHASERAVGIPQSAVYPINDFTDAFHLNVDGAARNSEALAVAMLERSRHAGR